ncbi:Chloride channel protein CLC-e [Forsythia ovata]|uniref:Chloride channel protein n=1 Tax=Forsythia ovata TaxID=205694 RepID=A0ABD1RIE6_9LAMI
MWLVNYQRPCERISDDIIWIRNFFPPTVGLSILLNPFFICCRSESEGLIDDQEEEERSRMCFRLSKLLSHSSHPSLLSPTFSQYKSSSSLSFSSSHSSFKCRRKSVNLFYRLCSNNSKSELDPDDPAGDNGDYTDETSTGGLAAVIKELIPQGNTPIVSACFVGLFTGVSVVLFNYAVHEIRDFCWDGIQYQGASWLREEPFEAKWARVILVPASGGVIVSLLNKIRAAIDGPTEGIIMSYIKSALKPILKTVAASVTLGTGNSLGPEGPSVEIGVSIAKGVGAVLDKGSQRKLSLRAAGSAAGLSSGFNAAVAGCFFAVESVLWPSPTESSLSLTNTTSTVILSAVIASVLSEIGLGSEPAFAIPLYDFRSPSELPLYLLLGVFCGLVSVALSKCTSFMLVFIDNVQRVVGIPKVAFPTLGGLVVGLIALAYPEILYWGFQNVDILLESRPSVKGLSADLLLQLVAVKIVATSFCRASGLVGGYYAPSLFIGAATGMAYGKIVGYVISQSNPIFHLSILEVASPQAYGLVGMAATLAGVCQVPLTAVLLLFELTQDYRIVLPLLGAVGVSSWITSGKTKRKEIDNSKDLKEGNIIATPPERYSYNSSVQASISSPDLRESNESSICELESSLCLNDDSDDDDDLANDILVSQAMRTRYVTVLMNTSLTDTVSLMLEEKQSFAIIVDDSNHLIGQLTLGDIQRFIEFSRATSRRPQELSVSELCSSNSKRCRIPGTVTPNTSLRSAQALMNRNGISQLPVILEHEDHAGHPIGLLDRESINLACRAYAIKDGLSWFLTPEKLNK